MDETDASDLRKIPECDEDRGPFPHKTAKQLGPTIGTWRCQELEFQQLCSWSSIPPFSIDKPLQIPFSAKWHTVRPPPPKK
jgi:hypothetical protein